MNTSNKHSIKPKLTLIRGIPGSGKSTLAKVLMFVGDTAGHFTAHFEADMYFGSDGFYEFDPALLPQAHGWCQISTANALRHSDVIVSNTFTRFNEIEPYYQIALDNDIEDVMLLISQGDYKSVHDVPEGAIQRMRDRFEYVVPSFNQWKAAKKAMEK